MCAYAARAALSCGASGAGQAAKMANNMLLGDSLHNPPIWQLFLHLVKNSWTQIRPDKYDSLILLGKVKYAIKAGAAH